MLRAMIEVFRIVALAGAVAIVITASMAAPDRPMQGPPPGPRGPEPVCLEMESNYGTVKQTGRALTIDGHPGWSAEGKIRDDGTVLLIWTRRDTGEPCPGVYRVVKDVLAKPYLLGAWGYGGAVTIEKDGSLSGATSQERIYEVVDAAPDPDL